MSVSQIRWVDDRTMDAPDLRLLIALSYLTDNEREAFVDSALVGRTYEDIAARSGLSRSVVGLAAQRARFKLAGRLFPEGVAA